MTETHIEIAAPLRIWADVLSHAARFKLLRWGRRTSKTRLAFHASLLGHGPVQREIPKWRGLVHGLDVVWIGPDFPQLETIWFEEIKPRFDQVEGFDLNETRKSVTIEGGGTLWLVSFENVGKVRGRGKRLAGVVLDESAHYDLEYAWRSVVRPALMDCGGWALFPSTTNSGPDGHLTEAGQRRTPSYFNTLCLQVIGGQRNAQWAHWHADARQNESIDPQEFRDLVSEYDAASQTALREEVYAELLVDGAGLAFPKWHPDVHLKTMEPDEDAACAAGMDWGHGSPGWFGLVYTMPNNRLLLRREWYYRGMKAKRVGYEVGKLCLESPRPVEYIALDSACFSNTGVGATIAEKLQEGLDLAFSRCKATPSWKERVEGAVLRAKPEFVPAPKGPNAVANQKVLIHEVLDWEQDADGVLVDPPALVVHPDCRDFARTIAALREDPHDREKFDTKGEDHPAQGFAYYLTLRAPDRVLPRVSRELVAQRAHLDAVSLHESEELDKVEARLDREYRTRLQLARRLAKPTKGGA